MLYVTHDHAEAIDLRKEMISLERGQIKAGNAGGSPVAFIPSEAQRSRAVTQPANAGRRRAFNPAAKPFQLINGILRLRFASLHSAQNDR